MAGEAELVRVYLSNAHRTSGGNGPGEVVIPLAEAQPLVRSRYATILGPATEDEATGVATPRPALAHRAVSN